MTWFDSRSGFRTAFIVVLAAFVALMLDSDDPWWAAMSALAMADADWTNVWRRATQRVFGTILGGFSGYWLAIACKNYIGLQIIAFSLIAVVTVYKRNESPRFGYAWLLLGVTAMLAMYVSITDIDRLFLVVVDRTITVSIGVITSGVVHYFTIQDSHLSMDMGPVFEPTLDKAERSWHIAMCISGALVIVIAPAIYVRHDLTAMVQIPITTLVVLAGPIQTIWKFAINRVIGVTGGGLLGLLFVMIGFQEFIWWLIGLSLGLYFLAGVQHGRSYFSYAGTQGGFAFVIAALASQGPVLTIEPVLDRLVGNIIGVLLALFFLVVIRIWQGAHLQDIEHVRSEGKSAGQE